ncbi:hypothetical protein NOM01_11055 [Sporolactobacillus sp. STSJ-5]|nr:hypothetical protein [Sporolactobacillus sp. STSJ-5]MCQ2010554.1 hypothetical protein [Sporolactobacillus sp. STSJ-5]
MKIKTFYMEADRKTETDEQHAVYMVRRLYDDEDNFIKETFGRLKGGD